MIGLFWAVEYQGMTRLIAHAVPMDQALVYGDMLTVELGQYEFWSSLARRGSQRLITAGMPTTPVWSEYEEWPRGRVLYDRTARRFVIRADRQLHQPAFVRLITRKFYLDGADMILLPDDHYPSVRHVRVPVPNEQ